VSDKSDKVMQPCQHSVTIRVPCSPCVESRLAKMSQDEKELRDQLAAARKEIGRLTAVNGELVMNLGVAHAAMRPVRDLEAENEELEKAW
jgi:hypothetical protein